jgi:flavorubredoxin
MDENTPRRTWKEFTRRADDARNLIAQMSEALLRAEEEMASLRSRAELALEIAAMDHGPGVQPHVLDWLARYRAVAQPKEADSEV